VHLTETSEEDADSQDSKMFPEKESDAITSVALTSAFVIFSTKQGGIHYFLLEDWKFVNEFSHACGIRYIASDSSGTRLVCIDDKGDGLLYNPVNDSVRVGSVKILCLSNVH
jgi:WD repeat-containing protein 19